MNPENSPPQADELTVFAFLDGSAGHEKQTLGILKAMAGMTRLRIIRRRVPPAPVSVRLRRFASLLLPGPGEARNCVAEWKPDLIIGTGSHTHLPMLLCRKYWRNTAVGRQPRLVTCMTPGFPFTALMDLCFVPAHDRPRPADNIVITNGPPSTAGYDGEHPRNHGLILIGGVDARSHVWDTDSVIRQVELLLDREKNIQWTLSTSPRTPEETGRRLRQLTSRHERLRVYLAEETAPGWVDARYAENDIAWVTGDSVSMIFEALTAGCRVGILPVQWKRRDDKFQRSLAGLYAGGLVTAFDDWLAGAELRRLEPRPDEAARCAVEIVRRWWPELLP